MCVNYLKINRVLSIYFFCFSKLNNWQKLSTVLQYLKKGDKMDWNQIWNDIVDFFKNNAWNIAIFFAVLILGIIVIKILLNIIRRVMNKTKMEKITIGFLCAIIKICL